MATQETEAQRKLNNPVLREVREPNRDPITGTPGAHPVGVGVGAAAGGAAGAVAGSVIPGVGTILGGAIGAIIGAFGGGYAGKSIAEVIDPTIEETYWRANLPQRSYYNDEFTFEDDYGTAYGYGYAMRSQYADKEFKDVEGQLKDKWDTVKGKSRLKWDQAREAVSDAWHRVGDSDSSKTNMKK